MKYNIDTKATNMIMDYLVNIQDAIKEETDINCLVKRINRTLEYFEKQVIEERNLEKQNRIDKLNKLIKLEEILFENGYTLEQIIEIEGFSTAIDCFIYNIEQSIRFRKA